MGPPRYQALLDADIPEVELPGGINGFSLYLVQFRIAQRFCQFARVLVPGFNSRI
jgi:hypothetical protein